MKNTIRVERAKLRINQAQLAKEVGLTRQAVHNIETEKSEPKVSTALKIAKFFGLKVNEIFIDEKG